MYRLGRWTLSPLHGELTYSPGQGHGIGQERVVCDSRMSEVGMADYFHDVAYKQHRVRLQEKMVQECDGSKQLPS